MSKQLQVLGKRKNEGRASRRYPIMVLAYFRWRGVDDVWYRRTGLARDISTQGVFIVCKDPPFPGTTIEVILDVPPVRALTLRHAQLRGSGTVVRLALYGGFAAQICFDVLPQTGVYLN